MILAPGVNLGLRDLILGLLEFIMGLWETIYGICAYIIGLWKAILGLLESILYPENPFGASRSRFFRLLGGYFSSQGVSFRASVG